MNANDKYFARDAKVDAAAVAPLPASRKIHVGGSRPDIRVPMREIAQGDTPASIGAEKNPPLVVYDTSGPYTDPAATIDIRKGLPPLRAPWIAERGDTVELDGPTSAFGRARLADPALTGLRFDLHRQPRARSRGRTSRRCTTRGAASSRRRWNSSPSARTSCATRWSRSFRRACGASIRGRTSAQPFRARSRRSSCATRSRAAARSSPTTSTIRNRSR